MPGTFAYNAATNTVTVTGGTSGSPADFPSFVTAAYAGTLDIQVRTGIAATDGAPVAVTRALRPMERTILGPQNAANANLYFIITAFSGLTSAVITMAGTDAGGSAQTETFAVTGNGTLYTTKWWTTVTTTQVTAFVGVGSFAYTLRQDHWGVIWDKGNLQYQLDCMIVVGDGSTATYFQTSSSQVTHKNLALGASNAYWTITANATFVSGIIINAPGRRSKLGTAFHWLETGSYFFPMEFKTGSTAYLIGGTQLSSSIRGILGCNLLAGTPSAVYIWDAIVAGGIGYDSISNLDLNNSTLLAPFYGMSGCNGVVNDVTIRDASQYALVDAPSTPTPVTLTGAVATNSAVNNVTMAASVVPPNHFYLINALLDVWSVDVNGASASTYRQYTCNFHVVDSAGNPISGATVDCVDQFAANVWPAGTVTTNASGNIPQQIINYIRYYWAGGNTSTTFSPHTFTFSKVGFATLIIPNVTVNALIAWEVELVTPSGGGSDAIILG